MKILIDIWIIVLLSILLVQDFKQRLISWKLIPLLFISFIIKGWLILPISDFGYFLSVNLIFIFLNLLLLTFYLSIKNKRFINMLDTYFGLGDVLFFIVISAGFSSVNFIVFFIASSIFSLVVYKIYQLIKTNAPEEIPLAGIMAIPLIVLILFSFYIPQINFYNDTLMISYMSWY